MSAPGPFQVLAVDHDASLAQLRAVREAVFIQEQGVPPELEIDDLDPRCRHVLARDGSGMAIGTARLSPEGRIGRMAVLHDWRAHGVGSALLHALLRIAREDGLARVNLHAQEGAIDFYRRHGFSTGGDVSLEAGIGHVAMQRRLIEPLAVEDRASAVGRHPAGGSRARAGACGSTAARSTRASTTIRACWRPCAASRSQAMARSCAYCCRTRWPRSVRTRR